MGGDPALPPGFEHFSEDPDDLAEMEEFKAFMAAAPTAAAPATVALNLDQARRGGLGLQGEEEARIEVLNSDGSSNLIDSNLDFHSLGLAEGLLNGIAEYGWVKPSKIQAAALPLIVTKGGWPGDNMIGQAQNGSGKTGTFSLGLLS